ncbi:MAG: NifU family protein [Eubacteriaceae bacterium]|jgi:Fe-S cluster biogenesis protein NfuA|nr:NifU family protein [Eubacteriaceae bacterium]
MPDINEIEVVLQEKVKPHLQGHGGDVHVLEINGNDVEIELTGACAGCVMADTETLPFIEGELKKAFPEIGAVTIGQHTDEELLDFARKILRHEIEL